MTEQAAGPRAQNAVRRALVQVGSGAGDVASVTRPLLGALQDLTSLESTYLTVIDWDQQVQRILVAQNTGRLDIAEGLEIPWEDTLCRRAMEDDRYATSDVQATWGDSEAARELGIRTYVSVPVVLPDGDIYGTICGASGRSMDVDESIQSLLAVFGRIVADTVARERQLSVESKRASESDRLLRARSEFIASAQHRLKTPLTVIRGWAAMLTDDEHSMDEQARRAALHAINRAASNAIAEVNAMLSESETAALARDLTFRSVDVVETATRCAEDLASLSTRHRVTVDAEDAVPPASSDPEALRVVLEHLIENAVKYSPDGGLVHVAVGRTDAGRIRVSVCDEGVGLPSGIDIFAPFTRGADRDVPGSGLGLHVVQSLVHAVGGEVTARRNTETRGSTVSVILPPVGSSR